MMDQNRGHPILAASIAGLVFTTVAITLRSLARIVKYSLYGWDDFLATLAWLFATALNAIMIYWVHIGFGQHTSSLLSQGIPISKIMLPIFIEGIIYNTGITLVKLSVLYYYYRIFGTIKYSKIAIWTVVALAMTWWICSTLIVIFQCNPIRKAWDKTVPGHCFNGTQAYVATAGLNTAIDFLILLLPMPFIWRLQMRLLRQIACTFLFIAGYGVMVISILRLVTTVQLDALGDTDYTWSAVTVELLFVLELNVGVFTICLPAVVQLLRGDYKDSITSLLRSSGSHQSQWSSTRRELIGGQPQNLSTLKSEHPGSAFDNFRSNGSLQYKGADSAYGTAESIELDGDLNLSKSNAS